MDALSEHDPEDNEFDLAHFLTYDVLLHCSLTTEHLSCPCITTLFVYLEFLVSER